MLPFFAIEDFNSSPPKDFILPLYAKAQAQVFVSYVLKPKSLFLTFHHLGLGILLIYMILQLECS